MKMLWVLVVMCCWSSSAVGQPLARDLVYAYRLAADSDPVYLAAGAGRRAALEALPIAQGAQRSQVNLSLDGGVAHHAVVRNDQRQFSSTAYESAVLNLSLSKPLYQPALAIAVDQAGILIQQADAVYAAAHQALIQRVAERYFAVLRAMDELDFAAAERRAFGQQLSQSEQRFEVGLIGITDVEEAKAGFDLAKARLIAAEIGLDTAREALREVTGAYFGALAPLNDAMPLAMPEPADREVWVAISLRQNLDITIARYRVAYQAQDIERTEAGHKPTVSLSGNYQLNHSSGPIGDGSDNQISRIGLTFSLPLYTGGVTRARVRQSLLLHQQAEERLKAEMRRIQRITRSAYLRIAAGRSRVNALQQAARSAITAADAVDAGFQVGTRTSVDVLQARQALFKALRDVSAARYNFILDRLLLKQAAGILSVADLSAINNWLH